MKVIFFRTCDDALGDEFMARGWCEPGTEQPRAPELDGSYTVYKLQWVVLSGSVLVLSACSVTVLT